MSNDKLPSEEIFGLISLVFNTPLALKDLVDGGATIDGDYLIWPIRLMFEDNKADMVKEVTIYYAINPYDKKIYFSAVVDQDPQEGEEVTSESEILGVMINIITSSRFFDRFLLHRSSH